MYLASSAVTLSYIQLFIVAVEPFRKTLTMTARMHRIERVLRAHRFFEATSNIALYLRSFFLPQ